ncbi:MAG: YceD family protein [Chthoniobacterales bacterium]|jgi:uncharacterized protein
MIGVHLRQISPEGHHLEGKEAADFLDLAEIGARATGPVSYDLEIGLSGGGLFATGQVSVPVEMTCVACLRPFALEIEVNPFATQVELEGQELVDLGPSVREDILLALPNHPRCDSIAGHLCPYQRPAQAGGGTAESSESAWDQLDKLKPER